LHVFQLRKKLNGPKVSGIEIMLLVQIFNACVRDTRTCDGS
jgi:hypothetical protein